MWFVTHFSTISAQTETNTKMKKNAFVRATINVKWSPKQAPGPTVCNAPSSAESLFEKGPWNGAHESANCWNGPRQTSDFSLSFYSSSHRHLWNSLENMPQKSLKQTWHVFKNNAKTLSRHLSSIPEQSLKSFWNISETCLKHLWSIPKHHWNIL